MSIFMQSCKGCKGPGFWPKNGPLHLAPPRNAANVRSAQKAGPFHVCMFASSPLPPPRDPGGMPPLGPTNSAEWHAHGQAEQHAGAGQATENTEITEPR